MKYIKDGEKIYGLKASMRTMVQMESLGIQSQLENGNIQGLGVKLIFDLFYLFLCAGEKRSYTYPEAMKIFDSLEEHNGADKVLEVIEEVFNEALVIGEIDEGDEDLLNEKEIEAKEKLDTNLMIVQLSAIWGIPADEIYNMTPREIATYRESYNSNLSQIYDTYRFIVFEGARNAMSDKVKQYKPLFTEKDTTEKQTKPTNEEILKLKEFTNRKRMK